MFEKTRGWLEGLAKRFDLQNRLDPATGQGRLFRKLYGALPTLLILLMCMVILVLFMMIGAKKSRIEEERKSALRNERPAVNVIVQKLVPSTISDRLDLPAVVEAWDDLPVMAEVGGKVIALNVEEGQKVKQGTVLAVIDKRDYLAALKAAQAADTLAGQTLERAERLYRKGSAAKSSYDAALAQVESARASLRAAELRLERTEIRAPIDGIVNRLDAKLGLLLSNGDPVAEIISLDPVKVTVGIPEADISQVRKLEEFKVTLNSLGKSEFTGTRNFLSKKPGTLAHLYELELKVSNPQNLILPGMFARVDVIKATVEDAVSVPVYAMITHNGEKVVYLEEGGLAVKRPIATGILEGWNLQVTSGLEPGERVIVVGHRSVGEGQPLKVIREISDPAELLR
jgi:RND family efflux transporter MFP subunit